MVTMFCEGVFTVISPSTFLLYIYSVYMRIIFINVLLQYKRKTHMTNVSVTILHDMLQEWNVLSIFICYYFTAFKDISFV